MLLLSPHSLLRFSCCAAKPHDAVLKALIRRSHAQRMATKDKFRELYDLVRVLSPKDADPVTKIVFFIEL